MMKRKKTDISGENNELTLVGHLAELRKRIIYSALTFIVAAAICYNFTEIIINDIISIAKDVDFVFIAPAELLFAYIKLALIGGLILSAPFLIFQIWLFIIPGLEGKERRYIFSALLMGGVFFIAGVVFAYFVVIPTMITFFMGFQVSEIKPMISFNSYLSFFLSTTFSFGAIFELPILMVLLTRFGILKVSFLKQNRKFIVLIIFVLAALLTPPDVVSQTLLAGPMILLAEIGIFLSSLVEKKKDEENQEEN